ncbi:hypothetical protein [Kineosporia babensis]|uniref:Uncharacterized protein n=1 Tax=Kineosporia babensis TaxID=499548 RepID=A0A9X1NBF4_9ACTN|nr:hypothetical protein [Kineosporia babensis]MCD5310639.1 hypothetical protein [Kineosporia babensis]
MSAPATPSAYASLSSLAQDTPIGDARQMLLRRLAEVTGAGQVTLWAATWPGSGRLRPAQSWPRSESSDLTVDQAALLARDDLSTVALQDGEQLYGALVLDGKLSRSQRKQLFDTANCLRVLHQRERLRDRLNQQHEHTSRLAGEALDASRRLDGVRALERRRVAAEILAFSHRRLRPIRARLEDPQGDLKGLRARLDSTVKDFRTLVRGIHPQILRSQGLRAALGEVAAPYKGRVQVTGSVPARLDHEVVSALYQLASAAVQSLAGTSSEVALALEHRHGDRPVPGLQVRLVARTQTSESATRAALAMDTDRLVALGGRVQIRRETDRSEVLAWVPDRLEPAARAALAASGSLYARVRAQALGLVAWYSEGPGSADARRLLSRLEDPVRVAFLNERAARDRPGLVFVPMNEDPDVILRRSPGNVEVLLPEVTPPLARGLELEDVLAAEVLARADLLRARTALAAMTRLVRNTPPAQPRRGVLAPDLAGLTREMTELVQAISSVTDRGGRADR